ncbi:C45 family autoproteolytic acyltransferase/hydrolase [Enterocloster clostridioformis]
MEICIPYIKVTGDNWDRGFSHGRQCSRLIKKNIEVCKRLCCYMRKVNPEILFADVRTFDNAIRKYDPNLYREMEAIAAGADVSTEEIVFLNVRTELSNVFWNKANISKKGCTSIFVGQERTVRRKIYMAQTWDWIEDAKEVIIMLHSDDLKGHQFITVTEAGIIGSLGINNKGVTVLLNSLPINELNAHGIPYHLLLRRILDSQTASDAQCNVLRSPIACALNVIIADTSGAAVDMELTAKGTDLQYPLNGLLIHTNHLLSQRLRVRENKAMHINSVTRLETAYEVLESNYQIELKHIKELFSEHKQKMFEICKHATNTYDACTIFTIIFELKEQKFYFAYGLPCQCAFTAYSISKLFNKNDEPNHN